MIGEVAYTLSRETIGTISAVLRKTRYTTSPLRHATSRKPPLDAPIDGREQPVQLLVYRRPERVKAQGPRWSSTSTPSSTSAWTCTLRFSAAPNR